MYKKILQLIKAYIETDRKATIPQGLILHLECKLSQFLQQPKKIHMEAALRIVRYIKGQPGQGILLSSIQDTNLTTFCDADWASCPLTRKSVIGYFIKFGNSVVSWKSKKQSTVSRSSAEAEYRSIATTVTEIIWMLGLLKDLGIEMHKPVEVCTDSKAAILLAANPVYHERTKHIEIDYHFIREKIVQGIICTKYTPTHEQPADMLTKGLTKIQHQLLSSKLGVQNIFSLPSLRGSVKISERN